MMVEGYRSNGTFGPSVFWGSLIAFMIAIIVFVVRHLDGAVLPQSFLLFGVVYVVRIYVGIVFLTYDKTVHEAMKGFSSRDRAWYHTNQTAQFVACALAAAAFEAYTIDALLLLPLFISFLLVVFWLSFAKTLLVYDEDRRWNAIILFMDGLGSVPPLLYVCKIASGEYPLGIDLEQFLVGFLVIYVGLFVVELLFVYRQSIVDFVKVTRSVINDGQ